MEEKVLVELIGRAQNGDQPAVEELIRSSHEQAKEIIREYAGEGADVRAIEKKAFIKAFSHIKELDEPEQFSGWLEGYIAEAVILAKQETAEKTAEVPAPEVASVSEPEPVEEEAPKKKKKFSLFVDDEDEDEEEEEETVVPPAPVAKPEAVEEEAPKKKKKFSLFVDDEDEEEEDEETVVPPAPVAKPETVEEEAPKKKKKFSLFVDDEDEDEEEEETVVPPAPVVEKAPVKPASVEEEPKKKKKFSLFVDDEDEDEEEEAPVVKHKPAPAPSPKAQFPHKVEDLDDGFEEERSGLPVWATVLISVLATLLVAGALMFFLAPRAWNELADGPLPLPHNNNVKPVATPIATPVVENTPEPTVEATVTPEAEESEAPEATPTPTAAAETAIGKLTVQVDGLNTRSTPSTTGTLKDPINKGTSFDVYEVSKDSQYTWYRIGKDRWCADNGSWVSYTAN